MLRQNRLNTHFFIDKFVATKKSTKTTRVSTCYQFFVADKSFVHMEPLRKRSDLIYALQSFAKKIGAPEALIVDGSPEENSAEAKKFYNQVGTFLRTLDKGTP